MEQNEFSPYYKIATAFNMLFFTIYLLITGTIALLLTIGTKGEGSGIVFVGISLATMTLWFLYLIVIYFLRVRYFFQALALGFLTQVLFFLILLVISYAENQTSKDLNTAIVLSSLSLVLPAINLIPVSVILFDIIRSKNPGGIQFSPILLLSWLLLMLLPFGTISYFYKDHSQIVINMARSLNLGSSDPLKWPFVRILKDSYTIYSSPSEESDPILLAQKEKIYRLEGLELEGSKGNNSRWYRIKTENGQSGYFKIDGNYSFRDIFTPPSHKWNETPGGVVEASSLYIREKPDISAQQIGSLPMGSLVEVLLKGTNFSNIGKQYANWYRIRTEDGKEGFVFSSYLKDGDLREFKKDALRGLKHLSGWVYLKNNPKLYRIAGTEFPIGDIKNSPNKGDYLKVVSIKKKGKASYYHIKRTGFCERNNCTPDIDAWIDSEGAEFTQNRFSHSLQLSKEKKNTPLFKHLNQFRINQNYPELNVLKTQCSVSKSSLENIKEQLFYCINSENGNNYHFLIPSKGNSFGKPQEVQNPTFYDLDRDGLPEILSFDNECLECQGASFSLIKLGGIKLKTILSIPDFIGKVEMNPQLVILHPHKDDKMRIKEKVPFSKEFENNDIRYLFWSNGEFREVSEEYVKSLETI